MIINRWRTLEKRRPSSSGWNQKGLCPQNLPIARSRCVPRFIPLLILIRNQDTINYFRTSSANGLLHTDISILREKHGYNEFSVAAPEPLLIKFAKTIYESPLILLLCGSATISALMGNIDDAVSITVAVLIVLTGIFNELTSLSSFLNIFKSWLCPRNSFGKKSRSSKQTCTPSLPCCTVRSMLLSSWRILNRDLTAKERHYSSWPTKLSRVI